MKGPNIIFMLADDLGWKDVGFMGSEFYETPNIDKLSSEGASFTNAYAACPVCSPTRSSILTGLYPAETGVTNFIGGHEKGYLISAPYCDHLSHDEKTIAEELRDNGYSTWHVGKWHLAGKYDRSDGWKAAHYPDRHGFDVNIAGFEAGAPHNGYFAPWNLKNISEGENGEYLTDRLTEEAIRLIKNRDKDKPFFLNLWYYLVHIPIEAKEEYIDYFKVKRKKMGLDVIKEFEEGDFFPCEHKKEKRIVRRLVQADPVYAAMIRSLDDSVGMLMEALAEEGIYNNTIMIFTSDNGGLSTAEGSPTCNLPLSEGKGWMYEGGTREPLVVRWHGQIEPGKVIDSPVSSPDFYPTLCDMAGISASKKVSGISLVDLLKGNKKPELACRPLFWHFPHYANQGGTPGSSVRKGRYKLIEFYETGKYELYDLQDDPGETKNLIDIEHEAARELKQELDTWKANVCARIPEKNADFIPWSNCHSELI